MLIQVVPNYPAFIAWDGAKANNVSIAGAYAVGFTIQITADIAADLSIAFLGAPFSAADPCAAGEFVPIKEVKPCEPTPAEAKDETVVIPKGTKKGTVCFATLPCIPFPFIQVKATGADAANVLIAVTLAGKY